MILGGIAFFFLIFFRWDKFWAWYQKPLDDEWGWDDNDNDEEEVITEKPTPAEKEIPQPKSWWERIKNWPLNNKVKTLSLLGIVGCLLRFMWWVKNNLL
jgi:hypothetical protein